MRVDLLCSGSKGNSCLIRSGKTCILVDCGAPEVRYLQAAFKEADCTYDDVQALLITHSHSDHVNQLAKFKNTPIYACCSLQSVHSLPELSDFRQIASRTRLKIGNLSIECFPTSHDSGPSMGFVIEDEKDRLVYVTDTGYLPADVYDLLSDADYYVFESNHDLEMLQNTSRPQWLKQRIASDTGHLCNQDASRLLCRLVGERTREVVLAHLSEEANTPDLALDELESRMERVGIDTTQMTILAASQREAIHFGSIE